MHDTALACGNFFAETYGKEGMKIIDIGGQDVNGSLRSFFENLKMTYICVDIEEHESVDIVVKPCEKLPFENGSIDLIVSTSCFEHDPCFWMTFKELCRITKLDGFIYINAPSNGAYHCYPGDNWRFYSDAGQALAVWSCRQICDEEVFPVEVSETFHIYPRGDVWIDFVCVWKRVNTITSTIIVSPDMRNKNGLLKTKLVLEGFDIRQTMNT